MSTIQETSENLLRFCGDQKYATIYADPPWRFQNRTGKVAPEHKRLNRYETMDTLFPTRRSSDLDRKSVV